MHERVQRRKQTTVQPTTPLRDELRQLIGHVGDTPSLLDVLEHPTLPTLGRELEAEDTVLCQVHVGREDVRVCAQQCLALEVRSERPSPILIILQRQVPVRREGSRQHRDVPKDGLGWLIQDVAHLVLEVLSCDQWVEQSLAEAPATFRVSADLATGAGDVGVQVEGLPEVIDGFGLGARTGVEEDADVGLEDGAEGVEEPPA